MGPLLTLTEGTAQGQHSLAILSNLPLALKLSRLKPSVSFRKGSSF